MTAPGLELPSPSVVRPRVTSHGLKARDVTVVVPVKNDQRGIDRLLDAFERLPASARPAEIVVVDNGSEPALVLKPTGIPAQLRLCQTPGPAAARNIGWRAASSPWVWFLDADCVPLATSLAGFELAANGAVAYAGEVAALDHGWLVSFYEAQKTLVPPPGHENRPQYLVTANALVWRPALVEVGGFDETFEGAGGEDIDLAVRLRAVGNLSYAPAAVVLHEFGNSPGQFVRRFVRYGRGNRQIERLHGVRMAPKPFLPARRTPIHFACAAAQVAAMTWGYVWG
jgi:glycosyltransferase involved in cell wall biosynthesis